MPDVLSKSLQSSASRRAFLRSTARTALGISLTGLDAAAWSERIAGEAHPDRVGTPQVVLNGNEYFEGPVPAAAEAAAKAVREGNRYHRELTDGLRDIICQSHGIRPERLALFPGSADALQFAAIAFTSPSRSLICADPTFEVVPWQASAVGAKVHAVPLTPDYSHDIQAMVAADPNAGLFYICNPNNPTGTITTEREIAWALRHKPAGSVLLIDEAYIHFSDAESAINLANSEEDILVLRTFSKIFSLAGLRCGFAVGDPELLSRFGLRTPNFLPTPAVAAATVSMQDPELVPMRKRVISATRADMLRWLSQHGRRFIPSQTNFFLLDMGMRGSLAGVRMAQQGVSIGRSWPSMPTFARITIGSGQEMEFFRKGLLRESEARP